MGGFAFSWRGAALVAGESVPFELFGVPFVVIGLYFIIDTSSWRSAFLSEVLTRVWPTR